MIFQTVYRSLKTALLQHSWLTWIALIDRVMLNSDVVIKAFFVLCYCVSCDSGHQSTVVQSRVWHFSTGDDQILMDFCFSVIDGYSWDGWISWSCNPWIFQYEKLWWTCILAIPVHTTSRTAVVTGECHIVTLKSKFSDTFWSHHWSGAFTKSIHVRTKY